MKRLLTALTIVSTIGFAMPVLAAPTVVNKQKVSLPVPSPAIMRMLASRTWNYVYQSNTSSDDQRKVPFTKVSILPSIAYEAQCGETLYRVWRFEADGRYRPIGPANYHASYPEPLSVLFFEVRQPNKTPVWRETDATWGTPNVPFACVGGNIILEHIFGTSRPGVSYSNYRFATPSAFSQAGHLDAIPTREGVGDYTGKNTKLVTIEGVTQVPGFLRKGHDGTIAGDSHPVSYEVNGQTIVHTLPWYKNLVETEVPEGASLDATFYRLPDGYAVKEVFRSDRFCPSGNCGPATPAQAYWESNPLTMYYVIRNGEAAYRTVAFLSLNQSPGLWRAFEGINDGWYVRIGDAGVRLHRIAPSSNAYATDATVLREDTTSMTVRYSIARGQTPIPFERWEAVIRK